MLKYYYDTQTESINTRYNKGLEEVKPQIRNLAEQGQLQMIDTRGWNYEERFTAYSDAIPVAVMKKSAIRKVYGSNRYPAMNFGKEVPSLFIYENAKDFPVDVYPRMVGEKVVTISDYLQLLMKK